MELLPAFPDAEDLALDLLAPAGPTVLATPDTITPPLIVVRRIGGSDAVFTDVPRIQVDTFGATHRQASTLAETCRQLVLAAPATAVTGVSIDDSWTESAPTFLAYSDLNLHRYVATYRIALRRAR